MTIVCLIKMFEMQQTILVCENDAEEATLSYTCTMNQIPETVINLANEYEIENVTIMGATNFSGKLVSEMLSMNPNLKIDVKEKNY